MVYIWSGRSRETDKNVRNFLMYNDLDECVDGMVFTADRKNSFIAALVLTYGARAENIFVIDNSKVNCQNAKTLIPSENVEWFHF